MEFSIITSNYNQLDNLQRVKSYLDKQTFKDFEWIIADDASDDGTREWCLEQDIKIEGKEVHKGYGLTECLNKASFAAQGNYLVYIMGDSIPRHDFLENMSKAIDSSNRSGMYCGLRYDTDWETLEILRPEWRARFNPQFPWFGEEPFNVLGDNSYALMTLNSMVMSRGDFLEMGGIPPEYDGYGKMDWYMAAWVYYHNKPLTIVPTALLYHRLHEDREDSPSSTKVFQRHLEELKRGTHAT